MTILKDKLCDECTSTNDCKLWNIIPNTTVYIELSDNPQPPIVTIVTSTILCYCSPLPFDLTGSSDSAGYNWKNVSIIVTHSHENNSLLNTYLSTNYSIYRLTNISSDYFIPGTSYTFTVIWSNFLYLKINSCSKVIVLDTIIPNVYIHGDSIRQITSSEILQMEVYARIHNDCEENIQSRDLVYDWIISLNNVTLQ